MTVTVTLPDGVTDKYMRFGDAYVKHDDGRLDVVRGGAKTASPLRVGGVDRRRGRRKGLEDGPFLGLIEAADNASALVTQTKATRPAVAGS